jgi:hypothetical protein
MGGIYDGYRSELLIENAESCDLCNIRKMEAKDKLRNYSIINMLLHL